MNPFLKTHRNLRQTRGQGDTERDEKMACALWLSESWRFDSQDPNNQAQTHTVINTNLSPLELQRGHFQYASSSVLMFGQHHVHHQAATVCVSIVCVCVRLYMSLPVSSPGARVVLNILLHWAAHRGMTVPGIWIWEMERRRWGEGETRQHWEEQ